MGAMLTVAESWQFARAADRLFSEEERTRLIDYLSTHPHAGDEIVGSGGVRKVRFAAGRKGKSGGARVIYFFYNDNAPLYLLTCYGKGTKEDLSKIGQDIIAGLKEALAHAQGEEVPGMRIHQVDVVNVDTKAIRKKLRLTQEQMALALGTSPSGYRKWEQGQRQPGGAARTLLRVMEKEPEAVLRVLSAK